MCNQKLSLEKIKEKASARELSMQSAGAGRGGRVFLPPCQTWCEGLLTLGGDGGSELRSRFSRWRKRKSSPASKLDPFCSFDGGRENEIYKFYVEKLFQA